MNSTKHSAQSGGVGPLGAIPMTLTNDQGVTGRGGLTTAIGWRSGGGILVPLILVALGGVALAIDLPLAQFCLARRTPGVIRELLERGESYGHAYGVVLVTLTAGILSAIRWQAWRIGCVALGGGLAADLIKVFFVRMRPCRLPEGITTIQETFVGYLSFSNLSEAASNWDSAFHSLPSAHTATAVALSCALAYLYPRGKMWFYFLACLTAAQRIEGGAHFLSDTLWGGAVGWVMGHWGTAKLFSSHRGITSPSDASETTVSQC